MLNVKQGSCKYQYRSPWFRQMEIDPASTISDTDALSTGTLIGFKNYLRTQQSCVLSQAALL